MNRRIKQKFYPEGYFEVLKIEKMTDEQIKKIVGTSTVASGKVIAYIAEDKSYLKVDMGSNRIGILYANSDDTYKNKSLVNEVINFCVTHKLENNEYVLERNSLVDKAKKDLINTYKVGDIIQAKIVAFLGYGVLVDIGWGVTALLHKTDIVGKPEHPKEVLKNITFLDIEIKNISEQGNIYVKMLENDC